MDRFKLPTCLVACLIAGVASMWGCGQSPVATDEAVGSFAAAKPAWGTGGTKISSSTTVTTEVGSTLKSEFISDYYYPGIGCWMGVNFKKYGTDSDVKVKEASFGARHNSLVSGEELTRIDMTVYSGTTLSDIDVVFGPSGLSFLPEATLTLKLEGPVTAEEVMTIGHFGGDDTYIESIETEVLRNGKSFLIVNVRVPGFSRYSLGGGSW